LDGEFPISIRALGDTINHRRTQSIYDAFGVKINHILQNISKQMYLKIDMSAD